MEQGLQETITMSTCAPNSLGKHWTTWANFRVFVQSHEVANAITGMTIDLFLLHPTLAHQLALVSCDNDDEVTIAHLMLARPSSSTSPLNGCLQPAPPIDCRGQYPFGYGQKHFGSSLCQRLAYLHLGMLDIDQPLLTSPLLGAWLVRPHKIVRQCPHYSFRIHRAVLHSVSN
jgi:hypothetical protein